MSPKQILVILFRRFWIIAFALLATVTGAGIIVMVFPPRFDAQATATVDPAQVDPVTGQSTGATNMRFAQGNMVALVKSQKVATEVVKRLNLTNNPGLIARYRASDAVGRVDVTQWIGSELLRNLEARFAEGTNVLTVTYKWSDALLAAQLANVFIAAFIDTAIENKVSSAQQTAQWFEPQTEKLRVEIEELRAKVSEFQRSAKLAPVSGGDSEVTMLNQLTTELSGARAELLKIESVLAEAGPPGSNNSAGQLFETPLLQSLKGNLASINAEISKAQSELGARNPRVLALEATQKSLQAQIALEIKNARSNLEARLATLKPQIGFLEKARAEQVEKLISIQNQRDRMGQLLRDLEVKQERLTVATRTAAAAQLQGQLSFSNISIIDRASPPVAPSFPKPLIIMPVSVVVGLALGTILALIGEALDRRVRSLADLDFATLGPSLGMLMKGPSMRPGFVRRLIAPSDNRRLAG